MLYLYVFTFVITTLLALGYSRVFLSKEPLSLAEWICAMILAGSLWVVSFHWFLKVIGEL